MLASAQSSDPRHTGKPLPLKNTGCSVVRRRRGEAVFQLHERLAADAAAVYDLPLCQALLMNDRAFPWLILVPRRENLRELTDLSPSERALLMEEIAAAERALQAQFRPDKLNVGALGNLVPQLHVHVVARFIYDRAWPGPVWGSGAAEPYGAAERNALVSRLREALHRERPPG
jgi:diadenosine tetraphosphate (Ap4A) HIT family hydrolase